MSLKKDFLSLKRDALPFIKENYDASLLKGLFGTTTYSGFKTDEAKSAMQKCIRRGLKESLQWGFEMFWGNKACRTNVWNRLYTICFEDIGPANPYCIFYVSSCRKENTDSSFGAAIKYLTQCKKSRVSDWCLFFDKQCFDDVEVNIDTICEEICNETSLSVCLIKLNWMLKKKDITICKQIFDIFFPVNEYIVELKKILNDISKYKPVDIWILCITTCFHLLFFDCLPSKREKIEIGYLKKEKIEKLKSRDNLVGIPDYAKDKHTLAGKRLRRGMKHFINIGSILKNKHEEWESLNIAYVESCKEIM